MLVLKPGDVIIKIIVVLVVCADNIVPLLHLDDVSHDDALLWRGGGEAGGKKKTETC